MTAERNRSAERYAMERRWILERHLDAVLAAELGDVDAALMACASGLLLGHDAMLHADTVYDNATHTHSVAPGVVRFGQLSDIHKNFFPLMADNQFRPEMAKPVATLMWNLVCQMRNELGAAEAIQPAG